MPANSRSRRPSGRDLEDAYIAGFLKSSELLPRAIPIRPDVDPPDFVVKYQHRDISIEIVQVHQDDQGGSRMRAAESNRAWVCHRVAATLESRGIRPLWISIGFAADNIAKGDRDSLATAIANIVVKNDPPHDQRVDLGWRGSLQSGGWGTWWPTALDSVMMLRTARAQEFEVSCSDAGWQLEDCREILQSAITKKDLDLGRYASKYDETWLLIVAEGIAPSSFIDLNEQSENHEYAGAFSRAFFYLHFGGKCVELRVRRGLGGGCTM